MSGIGRGKTSIVFTTLLFFVFPFYVQAVVCPLGDLDGNCQVDLVDVQMLVGRWLDPACAAPDCKADLVPGVGVNLVDYVQLAHNNDKTGAHVVISEFMADNEGSFSTKLQGQWIHPDWIELYNPSDVTVDLGGCYLIDDNNQWPFPPGTRLAGNSYLVVFASKQNDADYPVVDDLGYLHTNFGLNNGGDYVALVLPDGRTIEHEYPGIYPQQYNDWSYGLSQDLVSIGYFYPATPGKPNTSNPISDPTKNVVISEIMYHPYHSQEINVEPEPVVREFVEIYNRGFAPVDLTGWSFADGVDFTFPGVALDPNQYLVVAADVTAFLQAYPQVNPAKVVGGWKGKLSNSGEDIDLVDENGLRMDRVEYADEGDWAERELGPVDNNHRGWQWTDDHDGDGKSLELINPMISNNYGQNWAASLIDGGTPGERNSVYAENIPPMILDVEQSPLLPRDNESVTITTRIRDEQSSGLNVKLYYRVDESTYSQSSYPVYDPVSYSVATMYDDGTHGDFRTGDGTYTGEIPAHTEGAIIEYFIEASDGVLSRTCPAPSDIDGTPQQVTNLLYQVLPESEIPPTPWDPQDQPIYYLIMTEAERGRLEYIGSHDPDRYSDAQMNGTFISVNGTGSRSRYNVGIRNRGEGSRRVPPNNYRVNFIHERPWNNVTAININSKYGYLQLSGSVICQLAGLPMTNAAAVQVRVNGENLALTDPVADRMYGSYVHLEVYDGDFADDHFPDDPNGNIYKASHWPWTADLSYLGTDPADYVEAGYYKLTNEAAWDWSDLIELTQVLDQEPDATYVSRVPQVANAEQWLRWFAVQSLIGNNENGLANGKGDDYRMYRGMEDPRFFLLPHDLDTILGEGDNPFNETDSIFRAADPDYVPVIERFLTHPEFVSRYFAHFKDLMETTFSPENINPLLEQLLADYVSGLTIADMQQFVANRNANVLGQLPLVFSVQSDLPISSGFHQTTNPLTSVYGSANAILTRSVRVNGVLADWHPRTGTWSIGETVLLQPGINRIVVQAFDDPDGVGQEVERGFLDVWYDDGSESTLAAGTLTQNMILDAATGPWHITGSQDLLVPAGLTLTIEPGTTVFFDAGVGLEIRGRLLAEGSEYQRIRLTRVPGGADWQGIAFLDTQEDNRLSYVDMDYGDGQGESVNVDHARVTIDSMTWGGTNSMVLDMRHPKITIRNSYIPGVGAEPVHGLYLEGDEFVWLEGNTFGHGTSSGDIIDWDTSEGDKIYFFAINNVFLGGGDDGVDLDGTDAYLEGNVFMDFHGSSSETTSNAVTGGRAYSGAANRPDITLVRNIFVDVDHAVLIKEEAYATILNNVFVNSTKAAIQLWEPEGREPGGPSKGAYLDGNIFWQYTQMFTHLYVDPQYDPDGIYSDPNVIVNRCILPADFHYLGEGNLDVDPLFVDTESDFHLKPDSPARGAGPNGSDMGRYVPAGANISGEPGPVTYKTDATLIVGGAAITHYKYRVKDNGNWMADWSIEFSVATPITLAGLQDGHTYVVHVSGKNVINQWHDAAEGNTSRAWTVDTAFSSLRINEILAINDSAVANEGLYPDMIELYYDGPESFTLEGVSLSDDPDDPQKFVFGPGVEINPGEYLILYADPNTEKPFHLGFALEGDGEGIYLYNSNSELIDSVPFGLQIADLSLGRIGYDGEWRLTVPTFGQANVAQSLGNPQSLKINEWLANGEVLFANDFIELYNPHTFPVNLSNVYLTDNPVTQPGKHQLGPLSFIGADGFAVVEADDRSDPGHVDFRLSADQEIIGLFDDELHEIDTVIYRSQTTDVSRGRSPQDGDGTFAFFNLPTPGMPNAASDHEPITMELITAGADVKYYVPTDSTDQDTWMQSGYSNVSGWQSGVSPLGFGDVFGLGGAWRAFNDCLRAADDATADHVTQWTVHNNNPSSLRTGKLINFYTGSDFGMPTVTFTMGPAGVQSGSSGSENPYPATDAYEIFHNEQGWIVDFDDDLLYYGDLGWWIEIEFSDLNPTTPYSFVGTAIRTTDYTNRKTLVTISGHDGATNNSSDGIFEKNGDISKLLAGNNHTTGYVVRWDDILPGADGSFIIRAEATADSDDGGRKAYPFGGFMFQGGVVENELENQMLDINSSLWTRIEFNLDEDPSELSSLTLKMRHDDGFVAWLNGTEVARSNFTGTHLWNSAADGNRDNSLAADFETFDISNHIHDLQQGTNVLAVQIMNESVNDPNLLFLPELTAVHDPNNEVISYDDAIDLLNGLRITEIMYHPQDEVVHPDAEFIELLNVGPVDLNLTGVRFTQGIDYTFPAMILPVGDYIVIVKEQTIFEAQYGAVPEVIGEYIGSLSNGGEDIVLKLAEPLRAAILRFSYNDVWYPMTDGFGRSLVIREPTAPAANWDEKENWQAGDVLHGSPGF